MKKLFYALLTLAIFATSKQEGFAQLFTTTQLPKKLNSTQTNMLSKIYKHSDTKNVDFINIKSPLASNLKKRQIEFSFEEKEMRKVAVDVKRLECEANGDYVWFGQALFKEDFVQILLIKKGENVFGTLVYNERAFQIYGLGEGISALIELKASDKETNVCRPVLPIKDKVNASTSTDNTPETINPCSGFGINIIVFFTPSAQSITPDLLQFAHTCTEHYNSALVGNGSNAAANDRNNFLVLKGAELLSGFNENANGLIRPDLFRFNSNATANARQLNSAISADIKILITNTRYDALGIAFLGAEVDRSSGIVQQRSAVGFGGGHTFAHEVGHLLGADHDLIDEEDPRPGFSEGFNHGIFVDVNLGWFGQKKRRFGTVMCTPNLFDGDDVGGSRKWANILNFSSPMQSVFGGSLGNATSNDNTRAILENAPRVRNLTNESALTAGLMGDFDIRYYTTYTFEPIINCGTGPFSSEWKMFVDGVLVRTQTLPNDAQFSFFANDTDIPNGSGVEVSLKVTSSTGEIANASRFLPVRYIDYEDLVDPNNQRSLQTKSNAIELIYPNPVSDKFVFEYKLETHTIADFSIFSSSGVLVQYERIENNAGHFYQKFDVSTMPTGIYLFKALINKKIVTRKFSVAR